MRVKSIITKKTLSASSSQHGDSSDDENTPRTSTSSSKRTPDQSTTRQKSKSDSALNTADTSDRLDGNYWRGEPKAGRKRKTFVASRRRGRPPTRNPPKKR